MKNQVGNRRILAVLAHPDDEAFGMGGTLALYAARGSEVYLACATLGEAGSFPEDYLEPGQTPAQLRELELDCSAAALGIKQVFKLGYRDSGMEGTPDNFNPQALVAQPLEEVAERIAAVIREVKPALVLTFDPVGGYHHPDHLWVHQATVKAFHQVRRETPAGEAYLAGLYFHTMPKTAIKIAVRLMKLRGKDPRKAGTNADIDLQRIAETDFPVHVRINYRAVETKKAEASACHASQGGGGIVKGLAAWLLRPLTPPVDLFMQSYPEPKPGQRQRGDFFGAEI